MTGELPQYMTTQEVADLVRVAPETVRFWRYVGRGPKSFKAGGRRVLYDRDAVMAYIREAQEAV